jgi:hypothetical protein
LLPAAVLIATAACGTTLDIPPQSSAPGTESGLAAPPLSPSTASIPPTAVVPSASAPAVARSTAAGGPTSTAVPPIDGPSHTSPPPTATALRTSQSTPRPSNFKPAAAGAPGVTDSTITIGTFTVNGFSGLASSLGIKGALTGDQIAMTKAVVGYLNAHGGIAGRQIQLVDYDENVVQEEANPAAESQSACTSLTQDHHVYAVASIVGGLQSNFYECMASQHVIVSSTGEFTSQAFLARYPNVYEPVDMSYTRSLAENVDALSSAGWFGKSPKIGVVGGDSSSAHEAVDSGLVPALAAHGLKPAAEAYVSVSSIAQQITGYEAAALKFASEGINRVFFAPFGSILLFADDAGSQHYYPQFALDSQLDPGGEIESTNSARELEGSMGIGWAPFEDLDNVRSHAVTTPGEKRCEAAVKLANQDLSQDTVAVTAMWICDNWFFLRDALDHASVMSEAGFQSGVDALGNDFVPATTFQSRFSAGRSHDGADEYRLLAFKDSCSCYEYVSGIRQMK